MSTTTKRTTSEYVISKELRDCVDQWIQANPQKYMDAQKFGDFIVSHPHFSNLDTMEVDKRDIIGEEILFKELTSKISYYGLREEDLTEKEISLLKSKLDNSKYEDLFKCE